MVISRNDPDGKKGLSTDFRDRSWIWKNPDWSSFAELSGEFRERAEELDRAELKLDGLCSYRGFQTEQFRMFVGNVLANWNIEGIRLSRKSVRSSLAEAIGMNVEEWRKKSRKSREGRAVNVTLEMLQAKPPLTLDQILSAHAGLKSDDGEGWGKLRDHPEYVYTEDDEGKPVSVYNAPPENAVPGLMKQYVEWWRESKNCLSRSAGAIMAHLLFVTIHPFRDGNGRMARILADKYLSDESKWMFRPYSLSAEIEKNKSEYYSALESITESRGMGPFLDFMLATHANAIDAAIERAGMLKDAHGLLERSGVQMKENELELLHTCCAKPGHRWSFIEATQNMEDGEQAEKAWNALCRMGFIAPDGKFSVPRRILGQEADMRKRGKKNGILR